MMVPAVFGAHTQPGKDFAGHVFQCDGCGAEPMIVFQIEGQDHLHLECAECGMSFCPAGACKAVAPIQERSA
jgi:hypothetical protein